MDMHWTAKRIWAAAAVALLASASVPAALAGSNAADNGASKWKAWNYNRVTTHPDEVAARTGNGDEIEFSFLGTPDTAFLLTKHPSYKGTLLGDLTGKTLSATVGVSVTADTVFHYYGEPDACGRAPNVRFYFETDTSGKFDPKDYWWSNPVSVDLEDLKDGGDQTISVAMSPSLWSDWDGHMGTFDAAHTAAFNAAVKDVKYIGLSFGGGCFFANGVGVNPGSGTFRLVSFTAN
jgi:hypothetical protein